MGNHTEAQTIWSSFIIQLKYSNFQSIEDLKWLLKINETAYFTWSFSKVRKSKKYCWSLCNLHLQMKVFRVNVITQGCLADGFLPFCQCFSCHLQRWEQSIKYRWKEPLEFHFLSLDGCSIHIAKGYKPTFAYESFESFFENQKTNF